MNKQAMIRPMTSAACALVLGASSAALAQQKPEDAIKYRQSAMFIVGQNFGPLAAMAQGKIPYDKDVAARNAEIIEFAMQLPWDRFVPGTDSGNTKARPEIWLNPEDFEAKREALLAEVAKLAQVAKTGEFNPLKAQIGATGKACKACHDDYRNK